MKITLPEFCLVTLVGPSGCGKSTFARKHFKSTEIISSDYCRGLVSDDENDQAATKDAFELLHYIAAKRLKAGRLTVIDATNVQPEGRKSLIELARAHDCLSAAIVLDLPERVCIARNESRPDRDFGPHVIQRQKRDLRRSLRGLGSEGFRYVYVLETEEEVASAEIERQRLWNNLKHEHGPFDIIGDVHGCFSELKELLTKLGYEVKMSDHEPINVKSPDGRKAIFLGDLVDRGPDTPNVLKLVMHMVESGSAFCVPGNHDTKLMRKLRGRDVRITHGLKESLEQLENEPAEFKKDVADFIDGLISHYVLDDGKLVVAHAGLKESYQGRGSQRVREFALYGETTGETDEYGLPVRYPWANDYRGKAIVVYGHTPVPKPEWINHTVCIDTGCVFGGKLTALRYPEKEFVCVEANQVYYAPAKPFLPEGDQPKESPPNQSHELLDIDDVLGKRVINTRFQRSITVREENAIAALEVMSRFAVNPKWLAYLPPTMSPSETSNNSNWLEYPTEAFSYYRQNGVGTVICQEKHMGSRAVVVVCKDDEAASNRFGVVDEGKGVCYTRTGRRFFNDHQLEQQFITAVSDAIGVAGLWDEFSTDWFILDCELMPWSAKAQDLLRKQYATVASSATSGLSDAVMALQETIKRGLDCNELLQEYGEKLRCAEKYRDAYRRYCWTVQSLTDLKLAPFHILASEGQTHFNKNHQWHMETAGRIAAGSSNGMVTATRYKIVNVTDEEETLAGAKWWEELTAGGGEGMVVKPLDFIASGPKGLLQPALKCRGQEYLRIIYGPEYTMQENMERLRVRGVSAKRSLALREFMLSLEALERFARGEPLYRFHECVFAILALESEPVDPRL